MKTKVFLTLAAAAVLLSSCMSLPEPSFNTGLLVIKITAENTSELEDFLADYNLLFSDRDEKIFIHAKNGLLIEEMPSGTYNTRRVEPVQNMLRVDLEGGRDCEVTLPIVSGEITIFPWRIDFHQFNVEGKKGWVSMYMDLQGMKEREIQDIKMTLYEYENIEQWDFIE